jgi:hypothetical protein
MLQLSGLMSVLGQHAGDNFAEKDIALDLVDFRFSQF